MLPPGRRRCGDPRWRLELSRSNDVLALAPVIGGQAYRIHPMSTAEWEEKRILVDEKMGRTWQNAGLSERAKFTREYVLRQFWQSFVEDTFDLEHAIQTKSRVVFCHRSDE